MSKSIGARIPVELLKKVDLMSNTFNLNIPRTKSLGIIGNSFPTILNIKEVKYMYKRSKKKKLVIDFRSEFEL